MEILSKFWSLMTTENEIVTKILVSPTIFIEAWLVFEIFVSALKISYNKKQEILYIFVFSIISLILEFIIPSPFNTFINYISMFIIIKVLLKTNIIKTLLSIIIPTIFFALIATLILNPLLKLLGIDSYMLNHIPIYQLTYIFVLYLFVCILIFILKYSKLNIILIEDLNKHNKHIILLNLLLGIVTLSTQALLTYYYVTLLPLIVTILNFILLLSYFSISIYSLTRIMKLQITTQDLESAENYNTTLTYLYDNVRAFKHDFDNIVFILGGFIDKNDIDGLKKYYSNLEKDCERVNNIALLNPELINNSGIYNLLMAKYKKSEELKTEIHLEFFFDFSKLKMPIYDFSRILGILLDNAIEAAKDTKEKQVYIMIRDSQINNTQILSIKNNYNNKDVDTSKIFEKGITEKENHSGMGLWEVNQILKRNSNVKLITKKDDIYFEQTLEIYYQIL